MPQLHNVLFIALIGVLPFFLAACGDATSSSTDPRLQPPLVRIEAVELSVQSERSFTGIVAAHVQSDLGFRVPGKVLERLVNAGQTVKRGQALMRIDSTDLRLAMRAHGEAVAAAKARTRQAADDEARYRRLVSANFVSAAAYDKVNAAAEDGDPRVYLAALRTVAEALGMAKVNTDREVSRHYSGGNLLSGLNAALAEDGIDPDHPSMEALAPYDQFHGRGLEATMEVANLVRAT